MQEKEKYQMIRDKISGCVFAGALGDALGYVVEFDWYSSIKNKYGYWGYGYWGQTPLNSINGNF